MNPDTQSALHDFTLDAREVLFNEVGEQLEGTYGLLPNGDFEQAASYPALVHLPEARETRARLEKFISDESAAGMKAADARSKLAKEVAFTWLNRLVAFRMMEAHAIIRQSVERGAESRGFKLWLTEPNNEQDLKLYESGTLPQDDLGEGPRDAAYRHYLLHLCRRVAAEIRILFDPDNLASRLFPRPHVLADMLGKFNAADLADAWKDDQTIGWVYQYFIELEKTAVFARFSKREKIKTADIPAATQVFTPRWIVRALVQNSLGRLWLEMHPDSRLRERLNYLVPLKQQIEAPLRPVGEITMLDPATGTMHFGLVAFDLLVDMYREEIERTGEKGWPAKPSVEREEEIPAAIIANNLFGIDIDLRAVQLSALTLMLKAKSLNKNAVITDNNLACADVLLLNGPRLAEFLEESRFTRPIYERLIRALWERLKNANQMGSLLKIEKDLEKLIAEERQKAKTPQLPGFSSEQFETEAGRQEFWEIIQEQILQAFDYFARQRAEEGDDETYFTGEAAKGLRVLRLMARRYDVVATNPPYLNKRNMSEVISSQLKENYSTSRSDLFAAFIDRGTDFLTPQGRLAMITQQSFMFVNSYEALRKNLRDRVAIETMIHVGPRAFAEITGEKVNTTVFVLRAEGNIKLRETAVGLYIRLVKEPNARAKQQAFESAIADIKEGRHCPNAFYYRQKDFNAVPGAPWVYWILPRLRELFETIPQLGDSAHLAQGLTTTANARFLRKWWEVGLRDITFGCPSGEAAASSGKKWFPYMKGGGYKKWYGNQEEIVNWQKDGREIRELVKSKYRQTSYAKGFSDERWDKLIDIWVVKNKHLYFRRGVTWSSLSSKGLSVRLLPTGYIFADKGEAAFNSDPISLLAVMNSQAYSYLINLISPTIDFHCGYLAKVPVPDTLSDILRNKADQAITLAKADSEEDETTYDFIAPPAWETGVEVVTARMARLAEIEREIDEEVYRLYDISDEDRRAIEAELAGPQIADDGETDEGESTADEQNEESLAQLSRNALALRWISYAVGIVLGRFAPGEAQGLGRGSFSAETAARLRSLSDTDGIVTLDEGHSDDLAARVLAALQIMLGEDEAAELVRTALDDNVELADTIRNYLRRDFFKQQVKQYRKRPVYWLLESPQKTFGVYIFHERMTRDTLFRLRTEYVDMRINLIDTRMRDLRKDCEKAEGRKRRELENILAEMADVMDDLREFSRRIKAALDRGYEPHIDDGVLLNLAPLWELIPSWQAEPKKAWQALEKGDYDWSNTAMDYWPDRVRQKCATNKSFAIAHGIDDLENSK